MDVRIKKWLSSVGSLDTRRRTQGPSLPGHPTVETKNLYIGFWTSPMVLVLLSDVVVEVGLLWGIFN